jgi:hypothetical protein
MAAAGKEPPAFSPRASFCGGAALRLFVFHPDGHSEHAGGLLGVPVADEEAAGIVDEKLIELGCDGLAHAEAEGRVGDELLQRSSIWSKVR